jgi:hypothetical protein
MDYKVVSYPRKPSRLPKWISYYVFPSKPSPWIGMVGESLGYNGGEKIVLLFFVEENGRKVSLTHCFNIQDVEEVPTP